MRRTVPLLALALTACVGRRQVYVRYGDVHRHLVELRSAGHAEVEAIETTEERGNNATAEADSATTTRVRLADVAKLADGCPDVPPFRGDDTSAGACELVRDRDQLIHVGSRRDRVRSHDVIAFTFGFGTLGLAGGAIYCGLECESSSGEKTIGLVVGALVSAVVWAVASGGRD